MSIGTEEGATCNRNGCDGVIEPGNRDGCYCHISPPCHICTEAGLVCTECEVSSNDDEFYEVAKEPNTSSALPDWMRGM